MKLKLGILAGLAVLLVTCSCARADSEQKNPYRWSSRVTSVSVFKNGLGFFLRQGDVSLRDGWCLAETLPPATFGTLAVFSHSADETVDTVAFGPGEIVDFDDRDASRNLASKRTRLEAAKHLNIQVAYIDQGNERTASGKLVSAGTEYVVLQAENNSFAVPLEGIRRMRMLDNPLRIHIASGKGGTPARTTLGMAYLRKGITWIPEYSLTLIDKDTAELTLRATLVNEAEDLINCDVNFIVGVPHFIHTDYMAPLAAGQAIRTIGAAVAPPQVMSQLMNQAALANTYRSDQFATNVQPVVNSSGNLVNRPAWEEADTSDYTVYTRKGMTLRQGEKAIVTLFTKRIKYGHVYRWSPPQEIKHFLVLYNGTDMPWTTGPYLAMAGDRQALSQDILKYVPRGGRGEVQITTAINIAQNGKETEISRKLKEHSPSHNYYLDLVTVEGELTVRNFGQTAAELIIDKNIQGKPLTASDNGTISLDTGNLRLLERSGTIYWNVSVKPGETKTMKYSYERYVPSQ
ncbi:MAG: hypothetical protein PHT33_11525 [bacterium]|nr:hypothetical protein [bacterium]